VTVGSEVKMIKPLVVEAGVVDNSKSDLQKYPISSSLDISIILKLQCHEWSRNPGAPRGSYSCDRGVALFALSIVLKMQVGQTG
jgi:hypothetical protein